MIIDNKAQFLLPHDRATDCWYLQYYRVIITPDITLQLKQCRVWNYNKQLSELNMGVKEVEIHVDKEHVWSGKRVREEWGQGTGGGAGGDILGKPDTNF